MRVSESEAKLGLYTYKQLKDFSKDLQENLRGFTEELIADYKRLSKEKIVAVDVGKIELVHLEVEGNADKKKFSAV